MMTIAREFFKRSRPVIERLQQYGFQKRGEEYLYSEQFFNGQFRADICVNESGQVDGRIIDLETGEEYLPIRIQNQSGGFVGSVREEYLELLHRIADGCFAPVHFAYDQSNRIESRISAEFGVDAEFPWERYPGCGTFKATVNGKWFAILLDVEYGKLSGEKDSDRVVEVFNLKADPDEVPELIERSGIFAAWHMNKKHWISVITDDTLSDDDILELIRKSYRMVSQKPGGRKSSSGAWMIPSNPKMYDVDAGFENAGGVIDWHQHNDIKPGDEVYIYSSAPYSAIRYRCEVVESDLSYNGMFKESKGYERAMRIRLIEKFPDDKFDLAFIKAHGGSVVRSARTMPEELHRAIMENIETNGKRK